MANIGLIFITEHGNNPDNNGDHHNDRENTRCRTSIVAIAVNLKYFLSLRFVF